MAETPAGPQYRLNRRYHRKKGGQPLKAFALDLTIRFDESGTAPFVQDHNGIEMPFNNWAEFEHFLMPEIARNYEGHFHKKPTAGWEKEGE
jgi:hypothetical protein